MYRYNFAVKKRLQLKQCAVTGELLITLPNLQFERFCIEKKVKVKQRKKARENDFVIESMMPRS